MRTTEIIRRRWDGRVEPMVVEADAWEQQMNRLQPIEAPRSYRLCPIEASRMTTPGGFMLPKYKCHKEVGALKISSMLPLSHGGVLLLPEELGYAPFAVSAGYVEKHEPQVGGYFVRYADGYVSYSPAEAFESGYARMEPQATEPSKPQEGDQTVNRCPCGMCKRARARVMSWWAYERDIVRAAIWIGLVLAVGAVIAWFD